MIFPRLAISAALCCSALACTSPLLKPVDEVRADSGTEMPDASINEPQPGVPDASVIGIPGPERDGGWLDGGVRTPNPIPAENAKPGTSAWRLVRASNNKEIEGYALQISVNAGEALDVAVNAGPSNTTFSWVAYRLGYYGGKGAREMAKGGPVSQGPQPGCPLEASTGLVACAWTKSFQVQTGTSWVPGAYLIKLVRADGFERYVPFFVRNDSRAPDVLVSIPVGTWAAYNNWGGESLYQDQTGTLGGSAYKVSLDKPFAEGRGAGQLLLYDRYLVQWLEAQGVDVAYATTVDIDWDPNVMTHPATRVVMLSGHDEYWSRAVRDRMDAAVASGRSLLNFGANQAYWQIRFEPSADGRHRRHVVCYKRKAPTLDPVGPTSPNLTVKFRQAPLNRPESALLGVMFNDIWHQFAYPAVVTQPSHWIYDGSGLGANDTLPQVAGYEVDELVPNSTIQGGITVVSESQVLSLFSVVGRAQMIVRELGAQLIFSAGGVEFVRALSSEDAFDPRLERMAANTLWRALGKTTPSPRPVFVREHVPASVSAGWKMTTVAGVAGSQGDVDGNAAVARLLQPTAVGQLPDGRLLVVDSGANKVKRVELDGSITTVAARAWKRPAGLAIAADGSAYVSEAIGHSIFKIRTDGTVVRVVGADETPGHLDGVGLTARLNTPLGMTIFQNELYVADQGSGHIRKVELTSGTFTVSTYLRDFYRPSAISFAPDGTAWVVESGMSRIVQKKSGVATFWGGPQGYGDGSATAARFLPWLGVAVLPDGKIAVGDGGNYRVRLIDPAGTVKTAFGTGKGSPSDLVLPTGLAVASDGSLLVADTGNGAIRRLSPPAAAP